eukprot:SAG31_NODE_15223_length_764_cov_2.267669_1_plen_158_part_01
MKSCENISVRGLREDMFYGIQRIPQVPDADDEPEQPAAPEAQQGPDEAAAASLVALLGGGPSERGSAYLVLQATSDVDLAIPCVGPLIARLGAAASDVGAAEHRRCSLALAHLASLDPTRVGAEWFSGMRFLTAYAKGNAVDAILSKPLEQINAADDI